MNVRSKTKNLGLATLLKYIRTGEHVVIGGRPSMGKTSLALSLILELAIDRRQTCIFFSPTNYNSRNQLLDRLTSMEASIPIRLMRNRSYSFRQFQDLHSTQKGIHGAPIIFDDSKSFSLKAVEQHLNYLRTRIKSKIYVFLGDFLQSFTKHENYSTILKSLNRLAKKYDAILISLVHLNRASPDCLPPSVEDLRSLPDRSTIKRVILIYRMNYYDKNIEDNSMEITVYKRNCRKNFRYIARMNRSTLKISDLRIHKTSIAPAKAPRLLGSKIKS